MLKIVGLAGLASLVGYYGILSPLQKLAEDPAPGAALFLVVAGGLFTIALAVRIKD